MHKVTQLDPPKHHSWLRINLHRLEPELCSNLAQYAGLILTVTMVLCFFLRYYLLEPFILPRLYGRVYSNLNDRDRRSFVNHHLAGFIKLILLLGTAYPFIMMMFVDGSHFDTPYAHGSSFTLGDSLTLSSQLFVAMYLTELTYRKVLSWVAVAHHVGAIVITQIALLISLNADKEQDASIEFMLCFVWGAFDVIAELWPHIAIIWYRCNYHNHSRMRRIFKAACISTAVGSFTETVCVMILFGSLWNRWTIYLKFLTPILHVVFTAAQVSGTCTFYKMWKKQERLMNGIYTEEDIEKGRMKPKDKPEDKPEDKSEAIPYVTEVSELNDSSEPLQSSQCP